MNHFLIRKSFTVVVLKKNQNQILQLSNYAIKFLQHGQPGPKILNRTKLFHTDSVINSMAAIALKYPTTTFLRNQALETPIRNKKIKIAKVFGNIKYVNVQKAIVANSAAARQLSTFQTVFGYENLGDIKTGLLIYNDNYSIINSAAHLQSTINGKLALKAMVLQDEIRGRLFQSFSLNSKKNTSINNQIYGVISSIIVYGTLLKLSPKNIESAIGIFVSHYIPSNFSSNCIERASGALSTQMAIKSVHRAINGFNGPKDIFRNPQAIFRLNSITNASEDSPSDINLPMSGDKFLIMKTNFKIGLYHYESAGVIQAINKIVYQTSLIDKIQDLNDIVNIYIFVPQAIYIKSLNPDFNDPIRRQQATQSVIYIASTIIKKIFELKNQKFNFKSLKNLDDVWKVLILTPKDYCLQSILNNNTRKIMKKCKIFEDTKSYNRFADGVSTSVIIELKNKQTFDSKQIVFPSGHYKNINSNLKDLLNYKFEKFGKLALDETSLQLKLAKLNNIESLSNSDFCNLYECIIQQSSLGIDDPKFN